MSLATYTVSHKCGSLNLTVTLAHLNEFIIFYNFCIILIVNKHCTQNENKTAHIFLNVSTHYLVKWKNNTLTASLTL